MTIKQATLEKIEKLKSLISHENINPNYEELLNLALDAAIEKIQKKQGLLNAKQDSNLAPTKTTLAVSKPTFTSSSTQSFAVKKTRTRYIPRSVKQFVHQRSKGQCEYIHFNGRRCSSRFQIQYDHVKAFSLGGDSSIGNIQHLCRVHNAQKGAD